MYDLVHNQNRKALDELYQRYAQKLIRFALGFVQQQTLAEDIVQDCFIKVLKSASRFQPDKKFSTWIYTMVKNQCLNEMQSIKRREELLEQKGLPNLHAQNHIGYDAHLLKEQLRRIREDLSDKERLIYTLRIDQELSIREIAEIAAIPEGSVKSSLFYTLKKMASRLKVFTHEYYT